MTDPQPLLAALADPTRRAVFERLNAKGPASASQLADEMPVSRQAISKHLHQLDSVGLVGRSSEGRQVLFSANVEPLGDVANWLVAVDSQWASRLSKLKETFG